MKIGFISLPLTGHLDPMTSLARKLQARKHEVVFFGVPDAEPIVRAANFQKVIAETRGLDLATDVIEQAFSKNRSADKTKKHARLPRA